MAIIRSGCVLRPRHVFYEQSWSYSLWHRNCLRLRSVGLSVQPMHVVKHLTSCDASDALLCVPHTVQSALESGQEIRIVQIDFSAAIERVKHLGNLYKLWSVGVGGYFLSILTQFLLNRSQHVMVDGYRGKLVNVVSGLPQGSVLGPLLFLLYTSEFFPFWNINLSVMLITSLWWPLCHPQASELQ